MANNSEEDDYMSDAVLKQCKDVRPGLINSKTAKVHQKEKIHQEKIEANKTKSRTVLEKEKREEGLSSAIKSDNKGFAMLQKMGYKPGMAIGKKGEGRVEPVSVEVKTGRGGLGRELDQKRKQEQRFKMRAVHVAKRARLEEQRKGTFMERMSNRFTDKEAEWDLYKSQKVCEQLDSQKDVAEPSEPFFWPASQLPQASEDKCEDLGDSRLQSGYNQTAYDEDDVSDDEDDLDDDSKETKETKEADEFSAAEKLEILTIYLRNKHLYCVWCGTTFDDKNDMKKSCPGNTADAHG